MGTVTVSKKGWVVIPRDVRERHGIRPGDKVQIVDLAGRIALILVPKDPIAAGRGILKGKGTGTKGLLEDRRSELELEERNLPPPRPRPA